jgi:transposase-like protein
MSGRRKTYTEEFKLQVLREADAGVPMAELTRKYEIGTRVVYKWRDLRLEWACKQVQRRRGVESCSPK